jgi:hypothetical protein
MLSLTQGIPVYSPSKVSAFFWRSAVKLVTCRCDCDHSESDVTFSHCRFINNGEKFSFDVLRQRICMSKTRCSKKIRRLHRGNRTPAGTAVDGYPAGQHGRGGYVVVEGLRCASGLQTS